MPPTFQAVRFLVAFAAAGLLAGIAEARAADGVSVPASTFDKAAALVADAIGHLVQWVEASYAIRPALMIGLGGILVLPPLMLAGALLYRRKPSAPEAPEPNVEAAPLASSASAPRLELVGARSIALPRGRDLVQIGRHEDNDICIADTSVERYHAIIARSNDAGFTITDVSGQGDEGLRINGLSCASAVLAHGDMVELGKARLRFQTAL